MLPSLLLIMVFVLMLWVPRLFLLLFRLLIFWVICWLFEPGLILLWKVWCNVQLKFKVVFFTLKVLGVVLQHLLLSFPLWHMWTGPKTWCREGHNVLYFITLPNLTLIILFPVSNFSQILLFLTTLLWNLTPTTIIYSHLSFQSILFSIFLLIIFLLVIILRFMW